MQKLRKVVGVGGLTTKIRRNMMKICSCFAKKKLK